MAQLLLELFCEEIPARMQARAEADLTRLMTERLNEVGLSWDCLTSFSGPRRLGLVMDGLPLKTEAVREERKGPRVGSPDKAIEGFLRGVGLHSIEQCQIEEGKKGAFYLAIIEKPGQDTAQLIASSVGDIIRNFPWPKSMKFGEGEHAQRWVRPLQRIMVLLDGQIVSADVFGIKASNITQGHRIHGKGPFEVTSFEDYKTKLADNGVILMRDDRREKILTDARAVCKNAGYQLVEDNGLLEEITGLLEYPVAILGDMEPEFLDLPPEVIQLTMKTHQKYFAVADKDGKIISKFVVLANQSAPDGGQAIAAGNARVLSARLSDARHFWDLDIKTGLEAMTPQLANVTFHEKLGSVADRVDRIVRLAKQLAPKLGADASLAETAARLSKADLVSQMVYEFPELQGVMGHYYTLASVGSTQKTIPSNGDGDNASQGPRDLLWTRPVEEIEQIANAIKDHYKPQGPSDEVPTVPVSAAVALAEKLDTLIGFWMIDEKPTGSKDPFALRRAALGIIRILLDGSFRLNLRDVISDAIENFETQADDLLSFFADRLKVYLKDEGVKHDVIDAVFALGDDDLVRVTAKAQAVQNFINTEDGAALLVGYKRAANILNAEENKGFDLKRTRAEICDVPDDMILLDRILQHAEESEEIQLIEAIKCASADATSALEHEDYHQTMTILAGLRGVVDDFFEHVKVNTDETNVRSNRLVLLSCIRSAVNAIADFSRLEGG